MTAAIVKKKWNSTWRMNTEAAYVGASGRAGHIRGCCFQEAFGVKPPHTKRGRAICGRRLNVGSRQSCFIAPRRGFEEAIRIFLR